MDRFEFASILNSIIIPEGTPPEKIQSLTRPISDAITQLMPESLFRFRRFDDKTFDAFKDGIIYAVTADKFNDPYDTLPMFDIEGIKQGINTIMNLERLEQLKGWLEQGNNFPEHFKHSLPIGMADAIRDNLLALDSVKTIEDRVVETKRDLISSVETFFPVLSEISKRFSTIACFCESISPVLMWSHYADSHKGFALEYNFRLTLKHPLKNAGLFPVVYGEERVDISSFIAWEYLLIMGMRTPNPDISSSIKNALYKSSIWAYEKEWRLIDSSSGDTHARSTPIPFEPVAIYYGRYMSHENKQKLHAIAQEKGIKEYEMYLDYSSPVYEMKFRPTVVI